MQARSGLLLLGLLNACAALPAADEDIGQSESALTSGPDLQVTGLTSPVSGDGTSAVTISATVCDKGDVDAAENTLRFLYARSPDDWANASFFGEVPVPALAAGACVKLDYLTAGFRSSVGYLGATVDIYDVVAERNETNNFRAGKRIAFGPLPDLQVTSVTAPPNLRPNGDSFAIRAHVCNRGTSPAPGSRIDFYFSTDATISASDQGLTAAPTPALDAGACVDVAVQSFSPPAQNVSTAWIGAIVDGPDSIVELNEANNTRATSPIGFGDGPDFVITSFVTPPSDTLDGYFFVSNVTVCNQGTAPGYAPDVTIFASQDITVDPNDPHDPIVGRGFSSTNSLGAGECVSFPINVEGRNLFPIERGWYFAAFADFYNSIAELQEGNNVSSTNEVALGHGPDLVVRSIAAPTSVVSWPPTSFDVTVRVCNQGTRPSDPTFVRLSRSDDNAYDDADFIIDQVALDALAVSACRNVVIQADAGGWAPTAYFLAASVQAPNLELITTNNSRVRAITVTN